MTRIMVVGHMLPMFLKEGPITAINDRTWQLVQPLLDDGHELCLCSQSLVGKEDGPIVVEPRRKGSLTCHLMTFGRGNWVHTLQKIHDSFSPDCILAVSFKASLWVTKLRTEKPIWMDIYGDGIPPTQVSWFVNKTDRGMLTMLEFTRTILQRGDVFSTCGTPQKYALIGELGIVGRLNRHTFGYEFVYPMLPGANPDLLAMERRSTRCGTNVENRDFRLLWLGGYNVWVDVDTLFGGLEYAMHRRERIKYLSVGGAVVTGSVHTRFLEMVTGSVYREKFEMVAWAPFSQFLKLLGESDAGISVDAFHYETLTGTRTRLVDMLAVGLPVITSLGCELSHIIKDHKLGLTFSIGDSVSLGEKILTLADGAELRAKLATNAKRFARDNLTFGQTTQPLREWVRNPRLAPDREKRRGNGKDRAESVQNRLRTLARLLLWRLWGKAG